MPDPSSHSTPAAFPGSQEEAMTFHITQLGKTVIPELELRLTWLSAFALATGPAPLDHSGHRVGTFSSSPSARPHGFSCSMTSCLCLWTMSAHHEGACGDIRTTESPANS